MTLTQRYLTAAALILAAVTTFIVAHGGPAGLRGAAGHRFILWTDLPGNPVPSVATTKCLTCSFKTSNADDVGVIDAGVRHRYGTIRICTDPVAANAQQQSIVEPPGLDIDKETCSTSTWAAGTNPFEFWLTGVAGDPSPCACAPRGGSCVWNKPLVGGGTTPVPGPQDQTFQAGTFSGGCLAKACSELNGDQSTSMPAACL